MQVLYFNEGCVYIMSGNLCFAKLMHVSCVGSASRVENKLHYVRLGAADQNGGNLCCILSSYGF